ncbi:amino acid ABC transporter permease, partial [Vibrio vulnificus]
IGQYYVERYFGRGTQATRSGGFFLNRKAPQGGEQ